MNHQNYFLDGFELIVVVKKTLRYSNGFFYNRTRAYAAIPQLRNFEHYYEKRYKKNTEADLSQIHFAEYPGIGGCYSDLDYYPALGRTAAMAFWECHRCLDCQRRGAVSLCLAGL